MDLRESLRKQNEIVLSLFKHVIATTTAGKPSNRLFSPALINVILSFIAAKSPRDIEEKILSLLQASSTDELNTVSSKIVTTVLADSTPSGGPTIAAANGVWSEKSVPVDPSFKDIIENSYKAAFNLVDFRNKVNIFLNLVAFRHKLNTSTRLLSESKSQMLRELTLKKSKKKKLKIAKYPFRLVY